GLDVDLFAGGESAHPAGPPTPGRLQGLQPQLSQVADEAASHAHRQEQRQQQGDQAQHSGNDGLGDDAHGDRPDSVLGAVDGLVVEGAEFLEHGAGRGVPALRADPAGRPGPGGDGRLLTDAQRGGRGVLPEGHVAVALGTGELWQARVVQQRTLRHEVGDLPHLGAGQPADDQGGAEQGVLAGEEFTGPGEVDEGPVLLVQADVVDDVEVGQQDVAGVDELVVQVQRLGAVDGAVLDAAPQRLDPVEGVEDRAQVLGVLAHRLADVGLRQVRADVADRLVGGGAAAAEGGDPVGGARVGEVDQRLAPILLQDENGVLDGVADFLHDRGDVEQVARLPPGEHRGEGPDGRQGQQRHEKQRHDLPADGLPAKAHGLPQLGPLPAGGAHVRQQTARAYYRGTVNSKTRPEAELPEGRA